MKKVQNLSFQTLPIAMRMGEINALAEKTGSEVIGADATSMEDSGKSFDAAIAKFGKLILSTSLSGCL